ncbi:heme ABC exporter ATP-binding protein CcmA [Parerythrobacter lacustris]|uniref:Heme ABC exporter ATP-binding protein CcmA n=1 Tax=Parerythrobacter lacustris TaxID=2969984 RepID=A0ABT1XTE2_9SPHN|nr:heme ABC exporter ATP-binding protein CcmA [Parerythrobacter lacustris]MCR2834897.1 heme ABC exporter ATP-binding protein CcmA [Parerythrobacter lacustris]
MQECSLTARELACRRGDRLLFRGLELALVPGDAIHIAGPNGIGKSSLMRILAGLMQPYAGSVERTGSIGLVDERPALDEHAPLGKALGFWQRIDGAADNEFARLGLADLLDVPVRYLSTGQRKRAAFARLLGQSAPIWLLDEPLNGLDRDAVALVERIVAEHYHGGGIAVIASHQAIAIEGGKTVAIEDFAK